MARLTREEILQVKDLREEEIEIPEWGGSIVVRSLSGNARQKLVMNCMDKAGKMDIQKLYPMLLIAGCVEPQFTKADTDGLNEKSAAALEKAGKAIMKLSGMALEDIEQAEKN
jgi:hypothetical protein